MGEDQIEEDDELQAAKVVLDALQHQLVDVHHTTISPDHSLFLASDKVKTYSDSLLSCGLMLQDHQITKSHDALNEYTKIRDEERRKTHEEQMKYRRKRLRMLINDESWIYSLENNYDTNSDPIFTLSFRHQTKDLFKKFSQLHKENYDANLFMAGLHYFIIRQIHEENILIWTLSIPDGRDKFIDDVVHLLRSIMIPWINPQSCEEAMDSLDEEYSFYINPSISNRSLQTLLQALSIKISTSKKSMGKIGSLHPLSQRENIDGDKDEKSHFMKWINFCEIL